MLLPPRQRCLYRFPPLSSLLLLLATRRSCFEGLTQTLTLFPDRNFATEFFPDEVDSYIDAFMWRANKYLVGGHSVGYEFVKEPTENNRVIVKVTQNVQ